MVLTAPPTPNGTLDTDSIGQIILAYVSDAGQATKTEIREHCKVHGVDTPGYQKGLARIANQLKMVTEVTRDDGTKAYELKRQLSGFTVAEWAAQLEDASAPSRPREKYEQWYEFTGVLVLTSPALASRPVVGNQSARQFERTADGQVLVFSGNFAAMAEAALTKPGVPDGIGAALRYHSEWDQQTLPPSVLTKTLNPVPPSRPGQSGQGLTEIETLPVGTRIPFCVTVPGSHITPFDLMVLFTAAGRWVGFSPSAAHLGWGRFTPEFAVPVEEGQDSA